MRFLLFFGLLATALATADVVPPPPLPEPVCVSELPLPPVAPNNTTGSCTSDINARGTGCIAINQPAFAAGSFLPDGKHVIAAVTFSGAPATPDPRSIYTGQQLIIIKTDGTTFCNGDAWKCITCGVPEANRQGIAATQDFAYPMSFTDGKRILAGQTITTCEFDLTSNDCTPDKTFIYPIRFENQADGSGPGAAPRELRLHPDQVHIALSSFSFAGGAIGQYAYFARLQFNASPTTGTPLVPRYDLVNVNLLFDPNGRKALSATAGVLTIDDQAITVGEFRSFTGSGQELVYLGIPVESCNIDVFAVHMVTGVVRRLTAHPGYCDPIEGAPDDSGFIIMDTRGTGRTEFMAGLRGIPPLTDVITAAACSSVRNNGPRRFFQPWLIDHYGDRGDYYGQQLNSEGSGVPGSGDINDPEWNGRADPWWSPDATQVVYWQALTVSPECGGPNPLPCYNSTAEGERTVRLMLAKLLSRTPYEGQAVAEVADEIPWATRYVPGATIPPRPVPPPGEYILYGQDSGYANVSFIGKGNTSTIATVAVQYEEFSDDGIDTLRGSQSISVEVKGFTTNQLTWYSELERTGTSLSTQVTSPDGFNMTIDVVDNLFEANGTLVTTVDGVEYRQPCNGC